MSENNLPLSRKRLGDAGGVMRIWPILPIAFVGFQSTLLAGAGDVSHPDNPCKGALSDEYRPCILKAAEDSDKDLNRVYKQLIAQVKKADANRHSNSNGVKVNYGELLRDAQRAWITFIEKEGDLRCGPMEGGTGQPTCYAEWSTESRIRRTKELTLYLQDPEWGAPLEPHR
jgi:uncharacterized protein YecT (DUF1311 family)